MLFTKLIEKLRCRTAQSHQSKVVTVALAVYWILCPNVIADLSHAETLSIPIARSQDDVKELLGEDFVGLDSSDLELGTQILPFNSRHMASIRGASVSGYRNSTGIHHLQCIHSIHGG